MDVSWANQVVASQWVQQQIPIYYQGRDLYIGAQFSSKIELRNVVKVFHIDAHAQYKVDKSDSKRLVLKCT